MRWRGHLNNAKVSHVPQHLHQSATAGRPLGEWGEPEDKRVIDTVI